jgi:tetratricopeptide (TPR) repeat protein
MLVVLLQAMTADPSLDSTLDSVEALISSARYSEALSRLKQWTEAGKATGRWHLLASKAYDGLDQPQQAVAEAEAALAADPRQEAYYLQLGQIFVSRNTPKAALEIFDDALRLFPNSLMIRLGRGIALMNLGRYEDAEKDFGECLTRKPDLGIAFESLETIYLQTSRQEEAQRAAYQYQDRNPTDYRGYYFLAAAQNGLDSPDTRKESVALAQALNLKPDYAPAKVLLAKIAFHNGDKSKALQLLEEAVREHPDYAPAHLELAILYRRLGRKDDAARESWLLQRLSDQRPPSLIYHRGNKHSEEPRSETPERK